MAPATFLASPGAGGGTLRIGDTVRRDPDKGPPAMIAVLQHLQSVGFTAAPSILGLDACGRLVLDYIPGRAAVRPFARWMFSDRTLVSVATLLRAFHNAMRSFAPPEGLEWPNPPSSDFAGDVVCHQDVSFANVIFRRGRACALIDFEELGLAAAVWDVARAARHWAPLLAPEDAAAIDPSLVARPLERLALFADSYGLSVPDRARFAEAAIQNADESFARMRRGALRGHPGYLSEWMGPAALRNRRARGWMEDNRAAIARCLGV